ALQVVLAEECRGLAMDLVLREAELALRGLPEAGPVDGGPDASGARRLDRGPPRSRPGTIHGLGSRYGLVGRIQDLAGLVVHGRRAGVGHVGDLRLVEPAEPADGEGDAALRLGLGFHNRVGQRLTLESGDTHCADCLVGPPVWRPGPRGD